MITAEAFCEEELQYTVSFRQPRRVDREDAPPPGRFETTSSARLARAARHRKPGIAQPGHTPPWHSSRNSLKGRRVSRKCECVGK